jgi:hypothetical protein
MSAFGSLLLQHNCGEWKGSSTNLSNIALAGGRICYVFWPDLVLIAIFARLPIYSAFPPPPLALSPASPSPSLSLSLSLCVCVCVCVCVLAGLGIRCVKQGFIRSHMPLLKSECKPLRGRCPRERTGRNSLISHYCKSLNSENQQPQERNWVDMRKLCSRSSQ